MPRRKVNTPKYKLINKNSSRPEVVQKFINTLMWEGKKSTAEKIFWNSIKILNKGNENELGLENFYKVIENVSPELEVRSRRIGGATYQVPREVRPDRKRTLAIRWLISAARSRKGKTMAERLAEEFVSALKNEGTAVKKKIDTHKMAEANKAFAHYKW
jgi:small subunit ribosomal protein S7